MATVTGYTAERMKEIEDSAIVAGVIAGDNLMLTRFDGEQVNAGNVRGPQGLVGPAGATSIVVVTSTTRPSNPTTGLFIYETDTHFVYSWNGASWVYRGGDILCTSTTRPANPFTGLSIYETDTKRAYTWNGTLWADNGIKPRHCKVKLTAVQAIPHNLSTVIVWATQIYDSDDIWTPGAPADRFVIPPGGSGLWRFTLNAQFAVNGTGIRNLAITGAGIGIASYNAIGSTVWYIGGSVTGEALLNAGDIVQASAYQSSGAPLNIDPVYEVSFTASQVA